MEKNFFSLTVAFSFSSFGILSFFLFSQNQPAHPCSPPPPCRPPCEALLTASDSSSAPQLHRTAVLLSLFCIFPQVWSDFSLPPVTIRPSDGRVSGIESSSQLQQSILGSFKLVPDRPRSSFELWLVLLIYLVILLVIG